MERDQGFIMAVLALGLIATLEGDEKPKSAAANRCHGAHDAILKVCDLYLPEGINKPELSRIWDVIDGPVMEVINQHKEILKWSTDPKS
jgi:hypothetical protein